MKTGNSIEMQSQEDTKNYVVSSGTCYYKGLHLQMIQVNFKPSGSPIGIFLMKTNKQTNKQPSKQDEATKLLNFTNG